MASILKVDTIQDQSGNNIINESGDTITIGASGDTITVPTGASLTVPSGGLSGQNYPAFLVYKTTNQDIADATDTKVTWNGEAIDTDSAFASDKFTVPSGKAGKYFLSGSIQTSSVGQSEYQYGFCMIWKNGSRLTSQMFDNRNNNLRQIPIVFNFLTDLAVNDYIEIYIALGTSGPDQRIGGDSNYIGTWFSGFRIGD
jgi:hypothetical protein